MAVEKKNASSVMETEVEKEGKNKMEQEQNIEVDVDGILDQEEELVKNEKRSIYELLEEDIMGSDLPLNEYSGRF